MSAAANNGYDAVVAFPAMHVGLRCAGDRLAEITYLEPDHALRAPATALAERAVRQLERYRDDPQYRFDLPLAVGGTPFQRRVWAFLSAMACGETRTYGEAAARLASSARAVGQACGSNRLPIVIPCHRIVARGGLGGFAHHRAGFHVAVKRWLLVHEGAL